MGISYKIGADVNEFQQGIKKAEQGLTQLAASSNKAMTSIQRGAPSAAAALNSVGQVARDLPFGFIAIQNNLPIVLDQFGALVSQSGGVKNAFKGIIGALAGPAGLTLAFGAVVAGATALIQKYGSLGAAVNALLDPSRELSQAQKDTAEQIATELSQVALLVAIYPKLEGQRNRQESILKKLNEIAPTYFKGLDAEKQSVDDLTKSYDKYTKSLIAKAFIDANQEQIKEAAKKAAEELVRLNDLQTKAAKQRDREKNQIKEFIALEERLAKARTSTARGDIAIGVDEKATVKSFDDAINDVISLFNNRVKEILGGTDSIISKLDFGSVFDDVKKKEIEIPIKIGPIATIATDFTKKADEEIGRRFRKDNIDVPVQISPTIPNSAKEAFSKFAEIKFLKLQNKLDQVKRFSDAISAQLVEGFSNVFTSVGEGIGNVFAGVSNGFSAAQSVLAGLADILINVGKLAIATGFSILGIKEALKSLNPYVAIAGGIALVALGTAVKGKLSKSVPKFAEGGIVTRPTAGIFGEAGPEAVMPLEKLNSMLSNYGGGNVQVSGSFALRGNDLLASIERTRREQGRAF